MKIEVLLIAETKRCTLSQMRIDGVFQCFVLEDAYRDKKVWGETRIPDGIYQVAARKEGKFYEKYRRLYGHEFVPHLLDVPEFEYILIHMGNSAIDTHGCLLVGNCVGIGPTGDFVILPGYSGPAYQALFQRLDAAFAAGDKVEISLNRTAVVGSHFTQPIL